MRIQDVLRLVGGLVFLVTLPTGSAQKAGSACTVDTECATNKCCMDDSTCSRRNLGSVLGGKKTDDACECTSQVLSADGRCGCTDDSHCPNNNCCMANGSCSTRELASVLPGRQADDACECTALGVFQGRCMCDDLNPDCEAPSCCKANHLCSNRDRASVFADARANDACECLSGDFDDTTNKCRCTEDGHCSDNTCCTADGTCSKKDIQSIGAGKKATDACECMSSTLLSNGKCACDVDTQCKNNKCCLLSGKCSSKDRGTVVPGKGAKDECECATRIFDFEGKRCGCTELAHCAAKPATPTCSATLNVCVSDIVAPECTVDADCAAKPLTPKCSPSNVCAIGDPHMTGFFGQKFDFTGKDNGWYALISDLPSMQVNMRITVPVPSTPETTYITGFSLLTTDDDGIEHSIIVAAKTPHNLYAACPGGVSRCLADGSLTVLLDGEEALPAPGTVSLAPGIDITAVNTPGECRSFGFKAYWEKKKQDNAAYWARKEQEGARESRQLSAKMSMGDWILANPSVTNMADCIEYVANSAEVAGGLFSHQSEHSSFQIVTPAATIRLSHGKRYEAAVQDPTNTIDLPDRVAWQMNIGIDHTDISIDAKGILGETMVPTLNAAGDIIMHGKGCIRGEHTDYAVDGPLGMAFAMDNSDPVLQDATGGAFT